MNSETIIAGGIAVLALFLLVAVFQLEDRAGEPPARTAFQAMFVLHFVLLCSLVAAFSLPENLVVEFVADASLAGMYSMMAIATVWRSRSSFPLSLIVGVSLAYFAADMALSGIEGIRVGTAYIALINGLCAFLVWRRPGGANVGDFAMAWICLGWTLVNLTGLWLSFASGSAAQAREEVLIFLVAASPAFFAGYGVFLVVSYMLDGQRDLIELSNRDALTGLNNRRYLVDRSKEMFSSASRRREAVSLIELDIDHFKAINDTHGHHGGDLVLQRVASILRDQTRAEDVVARVGGEEFVVLMQAVGHEDAVAAAERIRMTIETTATDSGGSQVECTASFGVVSAMAADTSYDGVLGEADALLYRAKQEGRNRVVGSDLTRDAAWARERPIAAAATR